jgi:hypothetical protein
MIDDFGGEVGILFRIVDQEGDLRQGDFFAGHQEAGGRGEPGAKEFKHGKPFEKQRCSECLRQSWIP